MLGAKQEDGMDSEPNLRAVAIVCGLGDGRCLLAHRSELAAGVGNVRLRLPAGLLSFVSREA
jgi:hypothetical protein